MSDEEEHSNGQDGEAETEKTVEEKDFTSKIVRVLTVLAYLISVSMAAIMLSLYYIFLWNPEVPNYSARIGDNVQRRPLEKNQTIV